jgi:glycosyltransferase involved in cell wall biosynthesis
MSSTQQTKNFGSDTVSVSVVIPMYNYGLYVGETIDSLYQQTRLPDEIIVVDDCSTDNSVAVVREKMRECPNGIRFLLVTRTENGRIARAFNSGVRKSTGEWVLHLDADDKLHFRAIELLLNATKTDEEADIFYGGMETFTNEGEVHSTSWPPTPPKDILDVMAVPRIPPINLIPYCAMFPRRVFDMVGGYDSTHMPGEDVQFWLKALSIGCVPRKVSDLPLLQLRVHPDSFTTVNAKKYDDLSRWLPWMKDKRFPMASAPNTTTSLLAESYETVIVSVIIPVGPGHETIAASAVASVAGQSYRHIETIVVPNGDVDIDLLHSALRGYYYREIVLSEGNVSVARNKAASIAEGMFLVFLDADDYLFPSGIELMLSWWVENPVDYVYGDAAFIIDNKIEAVKNFLDYSPDAFLSNSVHLVTVLIRKECFFGFDSTLVGWEDWDFFIRAMLKGIKGSRVPAPILGYRLDTGKRRKLGSDNSSELFSFFNENYLEEYNKGNRDMGCGCGKARIGVLQKQLIPKGHSKVTQTNTDGKVKVVYTGTNRGATTFSVSTGRSIRAGANATNRTHWVTPEEAEELIKTRQFRLVPGADISTEVVPPPSPGGQHVDDEVSVESTPTTPTPTAHESVPSSTQTRTTTTTTRRKRN